MRFTKGLRWRTVKIVLMLPVFPLKAGFFVFEPMRNPIWRKLGVWNLKAFFPISLGIHLLFVCAAFVLFPDFKIDRFPDRTIEVSLLSLVAEEKPPPAIIPPKVKREIRKEEIKPAEIRKKEELLPQKEVEPELPPPVRTAEIKIPVEEPKPLPPKEELKPLPRKEEPKAPPQSEEPKPLPQKKESKPLPPREEPKPLPPRERSKSPPREEPKALPQKSPQEIAGKESGPAQAVTVPTPQETSLSNRREEDTIPLKLASSKRDNFSLALPPPSLKEANGNPFPDNGDRGGQQKEEKGVHQRQPTGNPSPENSSHGGQQEGQKGPHLEGSSEGSPNVASLAPPSDGKIISARPRYDKNPKPLYPPEAKKKGYQGKVLLRVQILPNGRVGQIEVKSSSGYEILDRSALAAVEQWSFVPAKKGETAVSLWAEIPIKFELTRGDTVPVIPGRAR